MNFFAKKNESTVNVDKIIEPIELYSSISKDEKFAYLRGIQEEVLQKWHSIREEKDIVVKMNTGAGKTLTGLIMLYSKMLEIKEPVVYYCPDKQLVQQVLEQSANYNIPTCTIEDKDLPEMFLNAEGILITTIQRLFNGKNIFDRDKIKLGALLIDDAHRCIERIIDSFSISINSGHGLYSKLKNLFDRDLKELSIGAYEAINSGDRYYYLKVPYWKWIDKKDQVIAILTEFIGDIDTMLFTYDLVINNISQYEMFVKNERIEITPLVSFVKNIVAYDTAKHRFALSATFVNDYSLIRDLDFTFESVLEPITPINRKDYGQRLVLTPKRYFNNLSDSQTFEILRHHLKTQNVVVLVPSNSIAKKWEKIGAEVVNNKNIEKTIKKLNSSRGNFVVFSNRYDGIDLSGDSCNVLVLHDHPRFNTIKDEYFQNVQHQSNTNTTAQNIEQGMGRSVRSSTDYSVVYLLGRYNLRFLRMKKNLDYFNPHTRRQIEMGQSLFEDEDLNDSNVVSKITEVADYCLSQDNEWKKFHKNFMDQVEDHKNDSREINLKKNLLEKNAIYSFILDKPEEAIQNINELISLGVTDTERAWYYQIQAHFAYILNQNISNDLQQKARVLSIKMYQPFLGKTKFKHQFTNSQYSNSSNFIKSFSTTNDMLIYIKEIIDGLQYSVENTSDVFEKSLKNLGLLLGVKSSRPEKENREGCDVLWISESICIILEAKSEKLAKNKISKSDIEQLYHSLEWFDEKYIFEGEKLGVTLQSNSKRNSDVVVNEDIRVLPQNSLDALVSGLNLFKDFIASYGIDRLKEVDIKTQFEKYHFEISMFRHKYLKVIK